MAHIEAQGRSPYTLWRYRTVIASHLRPALGHVEVAKLRASDLDTFYAALIGEGLNPLTVRKYHAVLSASLRQAVKWGWIERSPVERASPPSVRYRELVPPSVEEVAKFLKECEERRPELAPMIYVAATTGCRRGELCGLLWGDIDLEDATVMMSRSIADSPAGVQVKDTKTLQSRKLSLDPSTVEVLRLHREHCKATAASVEASITGKSFVWSQSPDFSEPYRPTHVSATFRDLREATGLKHVSFHALRHFATTVPAGKGVAVRTIAGRHDLISRWPLGPVEENPVSRSVIEHRREGCFWGAAPPARFRPPARPAVSDGMVEPTKVEGNTVDVADAVYFVGHAAVATGHRSRRRSSPREARLGRRRAKGLPRSAQASGARRKGYRSAPRGRDRGSGPAPVDTRPGRSHYRGVPGRLVKR